MRPSFKTPASIAVLLALTACGSLPTKESPLTKSPEHNIFLPASVADSVSVRTDADYNFILGEVYSREGNAARAIESFEKVLTADQTSSTIHMRLSAEYLKTDKMPKAIFHAEQAVATDPKNIEAHLFLGGLYSAEKLYDKAIAQYNVVLRLQPTNDEAPVYIGSLYADKKDFKKAEHYFQSLLKNPNYDSPHVAHYYLGLIRLDQKGSVHQVAAEKAFKKSLQIKPDFEDAAVSLANFYLQNNERAKALSFCLEFQKQSRFNHSVADIIAQIYIENGESDKAYEQLELIAGNSEGSGDTQLKMALLLIEQKRFHQAAAKLKDIVTKSPNADTARYYLAAVYEETGEAENAIREYMQVPSSSAHFSEAIVHAAHLLKGQGKLNQALDITAKGFKAKADKPQVYTMYASLLDAKSDYLGAARVLEEGLTKFSHNVGLLFQHALMQDRLGKKDVMIAQMKKVLEIEPNHVQSMSYLAFTLAELNQHLPEAERLARRALELEPTDGYVLDTLGWVLFKQKKFSESIQILEKAYGYQSSASIIAEHLADAYSMQAMNKEAKAMYDKAAVLTTDMTRTREIKSKILKLSAN
ncbi:tetratricopeptide repeat protein [Bdellovibrio bacteriovorus]|uniref:tetratricopeptide repeat protein n=1 Tax=Bdellovibrio bacteriovorus TaxID=959 RepID=UPI0021CE34DA|nr:tetratricopeptide repeat protein [Bdellovibrio bacteriovorus]UXR63960.1 tetratricopeptide repeat protein [Bdellovibrio bacteriovorus]